MSARKYWIGFNHVAGIGPLRLAALRTHFDSLSDAWHAGSQALAEAGLDRKSIANLLEARRSLDLDSLVRQVNTLGATALTLEDLDYPAVLQELPDAPPVLYVRGSLTAEDDWAVAIVGTRKASSYGRDMAYQLAGDLARAGLTVVSGLALGIDAAAHQGALDAGGRTIAVLPNGIDTVYPLEHRRLAHDITNQGALLTEFAPGMAAIAANFPPRNRIISGLSLGVVVVEAPLKSGAMLTVDAAAEQGRDVFAVPGPTYSEASMGTNRLIQEGAKLIMNVDDILSELNLTRETSQVRAEVQTLAPEGETERLIWEALSEEPRHVDEISLSTELPAHEISAALLLMELKGMVRELGHKTYIRGRGPQAPYVLD